MSYIKRRLFPTEHVKDAGGPGRAGFKGRAGDCVARSISIATGLPYNEVYAHLADGNATQRVTKRTKKSTAGKRTARSGIYIKRKWFKDMAELGLSGNRR
jgi:hypothetical protein